MSNYKKQEFWRDRLLDYIKGETNKERYKKLSLIDLLVKDRIKKNNKKSIIIITLFTVLILVAIVIFNWMLPSEIRSKLVKAGFSNGLIAIILAVWTFCKIKMDSIDTKAINQIVELKITNDVYQSITKEIELNSINLDRYVPFICSIFLFVIIFLNL